MVAQIIIERVMDGWAWDVFGATGDQPLASGIEKTVEAAIVEVEYYLRQEGVK